MSQTSVSPEAAPRQVNPNSRAAANVPTELISFAIGDDQYGVDIMAVREIKG